MITPNLSLQEIHQRTGEFLKTLSPHTPTNLVSLELHTVSIHHLVAKTDEMSVPTITKAIGTLKEVSRRLESLATAVVPYSEVIVEVNRLGLRVNDAISDLEDLLT